MSKGAFLAAVEQVMDQAERGAIRQDLWYARWAETGQVPWGWRASDEAVEAEFARRRAVTA